MKTTKNNSTGEMDWEKELAIAITTFAGNGMTVGELKQAVRTTINQAIAQERERIAKEVRTIRMPYPNPYGEYVRVPKVNRIIDRILQIITNNHE